jgi:hypothetical protein
MALLPTPSGPPERAGDVIRRRATAVLVTSRGRSRDQLAADALRASIQSTAGQRSPRFSVGAFYGHLRP